jgi:hypothetical protein
MSFGNLAGPGVGFGRNTPLPGNQGMFAIPTGVQRMAEQTYYSTYHFNAGETLGANNLLFAVPVNQQGQGFSQMSLSETNLVVGSQNTGDVTFDVTSIACEVLGAKSAASGTTIPGLLVSDLRTIQRCGILSWAFGGQVNTSRIGIAPLSMVGAGGGIYGATGDTGTPTTFVNNGNGSIWFYQRVVIVLPAFQTYNLVADFGNGGAVTGNASLQAVIAATDIRISLFNQVRQALPIS